MKYITFILLIGLGARLTAGEATVIPPKPDLSTLTAVAKVFNVVLILAINKTTNPATYNVKEIIHGEAEYKRFKIAIEQILPKPRDVQSVLPDYEVVFVGVEGAPARISGISTFAIYPAHTITDGINKFHCQSHSIDAVKAAIANSRSQTECEVYSGNVGWRW